MSLKRHFILFLIYKSFKNYLLLMKKRIYMSALPACVYGYHMHCSASKFRRGYQILWNWSYR